MTKVSIKNLLEAGIHYGHKTSRWNPQMAPYIYGKHKGIHIIDLDQTAQYLEQALEVLKTVVSKNGRVLFVGTKRQASDIVADYAEKSGQYYINKKWLGGLLTNWNTSSQSLSKLSQIEKIVNEDSDLYSKKEILRYTRQLNKLKNTFSGIVGMSGVPDIIITFDVGKEHIAIKEAKKLGIPVIGIVDTNNSPNNVDYVIPGNDDAYKAIDLYCSLFYSAIIEGLNSNAHSKSAEAKPKIEEKPKAEAKIEATAEAKIETK